MVTGVSEIGLQSGERSAVPPVAAPLPSRLDISSTTSSSQVTEWLEEREDQHSTRSVYCSFDGYRKEVRMRCKGRTCSVCRQREFMRLREQYAPVMGKVRWPNWVTIAPQNVKRLTRAYVQSFHAAVGRVLDRKRWRGAIVGGILFAECTNIGNGWHPHLHGMMDAQWVDRRALAREIAQEMGCRVFVDARRFDTPENCLDYLLGYVKKAPDIYRIDGLPKKLAVGRRRYVGYIEAWERKREYDEAYKGLRMVKPFGSLYGVPRPEKPKLQCPCCGGTEWITEWGLENMIEAGEEVVSVEPVASCARAAPPELSRQVMMWPIEVSERGE